MDWIELSRFRFDTIVGLLEREQREPQPLEVEVRLGLDLSGAAGGDLGQSVDYAAVAEQITFLAQHGHWRLLESLAHGAARLLLAAPAPQEGRARIEEVELAFHKPTILDGRAVPGVRVQRKGPVKLESRVWGEGVTAEVLVEDTLSGAYRVALAPGAKWSPPPGAVGLLLAGRPLVDGLAVGAGARFARGAGVVVQNAQREPVSWLVVGRV